MTLHKSKTNKSTSSFLTKLSTLVDFVSSMGLKNQIGEDDLSDILKGSGYNVELALERVLTGNFGSSGGGSSGSSGSSGINSSGSSATSSSSLNQRRSAMGASSSFASSSAKTPKCKSTKRQKCSSSNDSGLRNANPKNGSSTNPTKWLLCKRWTVACSKSIRGRVGYGEALDFTQNHAKTNHTPTSSGKSSSNKHGTKSLPMDPMVRFRSSSGHAEGSLNRYLCSILSPLLRLSSSNNDGGTCTSNSPLITIEGEALMEDYNLVIGSDIPLCLKVYINDPIQFLDLFQCSRKDSGGTSSQLFFQQKHKLHGNKSNNNSSSVRLPSYQGKKVKTNFSNQDLAEAAFHLLQWAERGEELPLFETNEKEKDGNVEDGKILASSGDADNETKGDGAGCSDEDYEQENSELPSEQVDQLNQLVSSSSSKGTHQSKKKPELSDPIGFKSGVVLRPYQRQALYWMCHREGYRGPNNNECDVHGMDNGDLELLTELAPTTHNNSADSSIVVGAAGSESGISCDCGPVVVTDESLASSALPVIDYYADQQPPPSASYEANQRSNSVHHPLWKRRYLATENFQSLSVFYVNELLGIASASPPPPPTPCVGGILADAMGLGKTVMLLSLILKRKQLERGEHNGDDREEGEASALMKSERGRKRKRGSALAKDSVVDLLSDGENGSDGQPLDGDDESWTEEVTQENKTMAKKLSFKQESKVSTQPAAATLVIAPLSLICQWEEELASKTNLSHLVYYDSTKKALRGGSSDAFSCVDVVVTTYGTIQSEYISLSHCATKSNTSNASHSTTSSPLLSFHWNRIILDEAHGIKNPSTAVSKACCALKATARWCVTGTPIQNSLQDVYGLLKFLRHEPWCEAAFWKNAITNASLAGAGVGVNDSGSDAKKDASKGEAEESLLREAREAAASAAFGRVRRVLEPILLRRTKDTLTEDGTPILTLPPVDFSVVRVTLSPPEREFYNALLERSQSVFEGFINAGTASKSWFAIFSLLQRLRQACNHVSLTVNKLGATTGEEEIVQQQLKDRDAAAKEEVSSNGDAGAGSVDDNFLSDLLNKFKKNTNAVVHNAQAESTSFAKQVAESLSQCVHSSEEYLKSECPICLDEPRVEDAVHTPCAHMFCRDCLLSEFQEQLNRSNKPTANSNVFQKAGKPNRSNVDGGSCPVCHDWVTISSIIQIKKAENGEMVSDYLNQAEKSTEFDKENSPNATTNETLQRDVIARATLESALNGGSSSKLQSMLYELEEVWKMDPGSKVLIFSQYLGFLDIVGRALKRKDVPCFRIDGKMSLKERVSMIGKFNMNKPTRHNSTEEGVRGRGSVFLVSMKAGGVGLNLVAASSVFIADPWWNQAIEDQCINRIHRIGQQAQVVRVRKFVVNDSVEEKIVNLQGKKKGMANEILGDGDSNVDLDSSKPTMEDFKLLFGR